MTRIINQFHMLLWDEIPYPCHNFNKFYSLWITDRIRLQTWLCLMSRARPWAWCGILWKLPLRNEPLPTLYITKTRPMVSHDDVIKWKHFSRHWPFVRGIHRSPVNSPHKGQWCGALIFFFDLHLNKRLSKQSWGWWIETPSSWHHCKVLDQLGPMYLFIKTSNIPDLAGFRPVKVQIRPIASVAFLSTRSSNLRTTQ